MGPWNTEKQFSSFLGLCLNNLTTGRSYAEPRARFTTVLPTPCGFVLRV
jgi:hypothetical protein